jgi:hypothetical protein
MSRGLPAAGAVAALADPPRTKRALLAAALLLAGCSSGALDGGAIIRPSCAANDGPAVQLIVPASTADYPQLRVWVWRPLDQVSGVTLTVPGSSNGDEGNARWCRTDADCEQASATVTFGQVRADKSVDVSVDALLADGTRFRDARHAEWRAANSPLCG